MSGSRLDSRDSSLDGSTPGADVDAEFAFHVDARVDELIAQGLPRHAAREEALRGFGDMRAVKTVCRMLAEDKERAMRRTKWWADWRHDVRFALRQLTTNRVQTAVLTLTIALGIGGTVAIFSVLHAVLLRPVPFADGERIVLVWETWREFQQGNASVGHFHDWTEHGLVFEHTAATQRASYNLADGEPERVSGTRATPGYFRVLTAAPALGRYFDEDDVARDARTVVLSQGLWLRRYGGDREIVGRTIHLNGEPHQVIGVAPAAYTMTRLSPQLWTPLVFTPQQRANYGAHAFTVFAKLKPGVSREAAQADMERVTLGIAERYPRNMEGRSVNVEPYDDMLLGNVRVPVWTLLASVTMILLIGCVNVANLLLARASVRRREIAIRIAIGGGRWRIVRQLLTESVVLALLGGVAGIGLASIGVRLLVTYTPTSVPRLDDAGFHPVVLLFALGLTLVTGLLFGLAPALRAAHGNLLPALREGGRTSFATAGRGPGRAALVVGEIALAVILVVGAGLFVRSAWRLQEVPVGFDPRGVLSARVGLPAERYRDDEAVVDAFRRILEMVRITPGVRRAGASTGIPLVGGAPDAELKVEGKVFPGDTAPSPFIRLITEDYVEAVGMPLVAGRSLLAADMAAGAPAVVLINERLARMAWPGENPLGKRLSTWTKQDEPEWREVVGVLGDIRSAGPTTPLSPELFLPYTQPPGEAWPAFQRSMAVVARASGNPAALAAPLGRVVRSIDPSLPVYDVMTMEDALGTRYASARFNMWLLSLLAVTGLVLAAVGIYGVIAYIVTQRTPEIGLRLALGATPASVLLLVLQQGTRLALAGIGVGLVGALGATSLVAALLFEVQPTDPATYVAGATAMFLIALLACAVPAWRAVRVNPVQVIAKS